MLQIYNALVKQKQIFRPLVNNTVSLYVCGLTVYDYSHIGNARVFVFFDVVVRSLRALGYKVKYVRNITDIDDKIIKRAQENNESINALTARFTEILHEDERALGIMPPDVEPKATEHIDKIIAMIERLVKLEYAYVASNGDVYYNVRKFKDYGKLAQQKLTDLRVGARVDVSEVKLDPLDFVLWKLAKPGEPSWNAPWGDGRPGWHSECAAMAVKYLGNHVDIHGGGIDLLFPHHQNETAQAEVAFENNFVTHWMHVGFLQTNKQKMAKSLGNFFTVREVLQKYDSEVLRYFLLSAHYRSSLDFSSESLDNAYAALSRLYIALRDFPLATTGVMSDQKSAEYKKAFFAAIEDDFNVPEALAIFFEIAREINVLRSNNEVNYAQNLANTLIELGKILGILQKKPEDFLRANLDQEVLRRIEALIVERSKARAEKQWTIADAIRNKLLQMNVEIEDTPNGTKWRKTS